MANTYTDPVLVKAKPHAAAEKQVGAADPNGRTDVINRVPLGLLAAIKRLVNTFCDGATLDFTDQATTTPLTGLAALRGYLAGLTVSNNGADAVNDLDIAVGVAMDSTQSRLLLLSAGLTKQLDALWVVGTNKGGLDTGVIADTSYHVYLIQRVDTGVVDVIFSASAAAPTLPANYTLFRRIGSLTRSAGAVIAFTQLGDEFLLTTVVASSSTVNPGTNAVLAVMTKVPTGVKMRVLANLRVNDTTPASAVVLVTSPDQTDTVPSVSLFTTIGSADHKEADVPIQVRTDTSARVRFRASASDANVLVRFMTVGWIDRRGQDD